MRCADHNYKYYFFGTASWIFEPIFRYGLLYEDKINKFNGKKDLLVWHGRDFRRKFAKDIDNKAPPIHLIQQIVNDPSRRQFVCRPDMAARCVETLENHLAPIHPDRQRTVGLPFTFSPRTDIYHDMPGSH